jgi:hypothetical protein
LHKDGLQPKQPLSTMPEGGFLYALKYTAWKTMKGMVVKMGK